MRQCALLIVCIFWCFSANYKAFHLQEVVVKVRQMTSKGTLCHEHSTFSDGMGWEGLLETGWCQEFQTVGAFSLYLQIFYFPLDMWVQILCTNQNFLRNHGCNCTHCTHDNTTPEKGASLVCSWYLRRLTSSFSFLWHHFSTYIVAILSSVRNLETASSMYQHGESWRISQ